MLFKASNGALNQNSVGVKKLNDEEMAQVKGGLYLSNFFVNGRKGNEYISANTQTGQVMHYSISYRIMLDKTEAGLQAIHNYDMLGTPKTRYMHFNYLANESRGEIPVLTVVYDYSAGFVSFSVNVLNRYTGSSRRVDSYTENAILGRHRFEALDQMYRDLKALCSIILILRYSNVFWNTFCLYNEKAKFETRFKQ